jgi:NAD(P)-dependent dehydrogenase (short-subunit alcohol dehydrogenase family)
VGVIRAENSLLKVVTHSVVCAQIDRYYRGAIMKPIEEKVVLITGATDGIGKITAQGLAGMDATVLLHGRDRYKGEATLAEIGEETGNNRLRYYHADLADLAAVRKLVAIVKTDHDHLDVLINNAGLGPGPSSHTARESSRDGYELRFAVNYLAPFLLTRTLLPLIRQAAPSRIVNLSSAAQEPIDFTDLMFTRGYDPMSAYARSKTALTMFTFELAQRLQKDAITVNCLHPGSLLDTKMVRESFGAPWGSAESGAEAVMRMAVSPALEGVTGKYFDRTSEARASDQAYDREARRKLWRLSEAYVDG